MDQPEAPAAPRFFRLARFVATGGGTGYAPIASGTFGSLPGLLIGALLWHAGGPWAVVVGLALVIPLGFWAAGVVGPHFGGRDPGQIVIDEVAGQLVALAFFPADPRHLLAAFLLFRIFDVLKPFPANRLEALPGASGIMSDDLVAGLYANLTLRALQWLAPAWWVAGSVR